MNTLCRLLLVGIALQTTDAIAGAESAAGSMVVPVWPDQPPGVVCTEAEKDLPAHGNGDNVQRTTNVSRPTVTVFPAQGSTRPGAAILICPGGAYNYVVMNKEGSEIAAWLNSLGITGIVLKYRVPNNNPVKVWPELCADWLEALKSKISNLLKLPESKGGL